jgi:hypothetical protein
LVGIQHIQPSRIAIIAEGQDKMITIKTFNDDIKGFDDDKYYEDRCIDKTKFDSFMFCNIIVKP